MKKEVDRQKKDVTRVLVRTKYNLVLNETFNVEINKEVFMVKIIEDSQGPMRLEMLKHIENKVSRC